MNGFRNYGAGVQLLDWMRRVERERLDRQRMGGWYNEQENRIAQQKRAERNSGLTPFWSQRQPFWSQGGQLPRIIEWPLLTLVCPVEGCKTPPVRTFQYKRLTEN